MIISNFTVTELEHIRDKCDFVGEEIIVFELRGSGVPLKDIADILDISIDMVKKISRKVNKKIRKVL